MRVKFWGVRGSLPAPLLPGQVQSKISAVLGRLTPADLDQPEDRERFLADLPQWLFGTIGGNSPCVSAHIESSDTLLIFDAGTGIRELGIAMGKEKPKRTDYHLLFSHLHWDHIMGFPFFNPAYDPSVKINFYSPMTDFDKALYGQMSAPYFPIQMEVMASEKQFFTLAKPIELPGCKISYRKMNHPGGCYAYRVDDGKHVFIYATDTELSANDFIKDEENTAFFSNVDMIVIDSQYTLGEAIEKYNWGHSAFSLAVDFTANWNIGHMVLFHFDPSYDDHKLYNILQSAKWYTERMNLKDIKLSLAMEGTEIVL